MLNYFITLKKGHAEAILAKLANMENCVKSY